MDIIVSVSCATFELHLPILFAYALCLVLIGRTLRSFFV